MPFSVKLSANFESVIRQRGSAYFQEGKVKVKEAAGDLVLARVEGSRSYGVGLRRDGDTLMGFCDCPLFKERHVLCKHIWALVLAVEAREKADWMDDRLEKVLPDLDDSEDDDDSSSDAPDPAAGVRMTGPLQWSRGAKKAPPKLPAWKLELRKLGVKQDLPTPGESLPEWPATRQVYYLLDLPGAGGGSEDGIAVELCFTEPQPKGGPAKARFRAASLTQIAALPEGPDREILALLCSMNGEGGRSGDAPAATLVPRYRLRGPQIATFLPRMCATGRCLLAGQDPLDTPPGLEWDGDSPWNLRVSVGSGKNPGNMDVVGRLERGEEFLALPKSGLRVSGGIIYSAGRIGRLADADAEEWVRMFQTRGRLEVPDAQIDDFLGTFFARDWAPVLAVPEELKPHAVEGEPHPGLVLKDAASHKVLGVSNLIGEVVFDYEGQRISLGSQQRSLYFSDGRRLMSRNEAAETAARELLTRLGFLPLRSHGIGPKKMVQIPPKEVNPALRGLVQAGWSVEARGKAYRKPSRMHLEVRSGLDWFDLALGAEFGNQKLGIPELLAALKRNDGLVNLADGSLGVLPSEWLKKFGLLAELGSEAAEDGALRFKRSQAGLLDLLLADKKDAEIHMDEAFLRSREEMLRFEKPEPTLEPETFRGELRPYQREGLAWMNFLEKAGFGGCLADDMGLGKTVQVLALLERRRAATAGSPTPVRPSLLVVPKSLIFNWQAEAGRFAPQLRILAHTGLERAKSAEEFVGACDIILTTYGTLRRDILMFKDMEFDYIVLDESQAAKNSATDTAKSIHLLKGAHRLALSGTPVENHLGELWNLLEFLNPGLLGTTAHTKALGGGGAPPDPATLTIVAGALRPFILRRTKEKVAQDLPAKLEKTLFCELEPEQRRLYDDLRTHYRSSLFKRVEKDGLGKSKMWVLEALLRLRQAACHPGLVDKTRLEEPCSKLDALLPQLKEVTEEGHKALVFSQFTSFLAIVRSQLDQAGMTYEYLDGKTRDRNACVERFQTDPQTKIFLISLKAGGVGLNLTAADYVFLLDPWWNPAVEAQALDRAHRIGQTRQVFAYRLIAKDTVEEKVMQLQETKRGLAEGILNADESVMRGLTLEDLQRLLE
jgi:superfamily II DNA or RNA helicase